MEERDYNMQHRIILTNREEMTISGVIDVVSFDEEAVVVETEMGILEIRGELLHVNKLNLETGELSLSGEVQGIEYDDKHGYKKGDSSFLSKLFG